MIDVLTKQYEHERARLEALSKNAKHAGDYLNPVFGQGPSNPLLMLIGEAPGGEEAKKGMPFVGKAGKQLDELLHIAKINRAAVFVSNAVKFRPMKVKEKSVFNRTPTAQEVNASLPLLAEEIRILCPRVIATLGNTPLKAVLTLGAEATKTIGEAHGRVLTLCIDGAKMALFPLYHPASAIYNRALLPTLQADLVALGEYIGNANATTECTR